MRDLKAKLMSKIIGTTESIT